jgi:hypothetical protein
MAQINPGTTFTGQNPTLMQRSLDENILVLDPRDTPLLTLIGGLDGASGKFTFRTTSDNTKYEWMEDSLGFRTVTNGAAASALASTTIVLVDGDATKLEPGHILKYDTVQAWVSAVNADGKTVTVVRPYAGSTDIIIPAGATIEIVGMARPEGAESDQIIGTTVTFDYNYTDIVHREISESGTMQALNLLGKGDPWQYEAAKLVPNMQIEIEKMLLYGLRNYDATRRLRSMGGVKTFIKTNVQASVGSLTKTAFDNAALAMFKGSGGGDKYAIISPNNYVKLVTQFTAAETVQHSEGGGEYWWGMCPIGVYTKFGKINLYIDRWLDDTFIPIIDLNHIGMKTLRPFFIKPLAEGGDYTRQEVKWEGTLCMRGDKAHALLAGITG